jgi:hypothetical protein
MVVQTLANVYQTTRSQVAGQTAANCHRQMLASRTLRSALDIYTVRLFTGKCAVGKSYYLVLELIRSDDFVVSLEGSKLKSRET